MAKQNLTTPYTTTATVEVEKELTQCALESVQINFGRGGGEPNIQITWSEGYDDAGDYKRAKRDRDQPDVADIDLDKIEKEIWKALRTRGKVDADVGA